MFKKIFAAAAFAAAAISGAHATVVTYNNQGNFEAALTDGVTVIDTWANIGKTTAELSALTSGAEFFSEPSYVRSDGALLNGRAFLGTENPSLGLNFDSGVNGVGITTFNIADGGRVLAYSGLNGTGTLLGQVGFGGSAMFGGLTSTDLIFSVIFTCEFNYDLACGVTNPIFGSFAEQDDNHTPEVPVPAAAFVFLAGAGVLGAAKRRRKA